MPLSKMTAPCICAALLLCAATSTPPVEAASKLHVTVSIPPQAYLFDRIGGNALVTETLIPPGRSPENYEPTARQLVALGKTDIYCKVGHPAFVFERNHLDPILHHQHGIEIIDMWALSLQAASLDQSGQPGSERRKSSAGASPKSHIGVGFDRSTDPHIWLSPQLMLGTAREITRLLSTLLAPQAGIFQENLASLERDIERLDADINALIQPTAQRTFVVQHPAWGHFAAYYGLEQLAIEKQGKEPSPGHMISLIDRARAEDIRTILAQSKNSDRAARIVAKEIDATIVSLDPLAYEWLTGLRNTAQFLLAGMQHG
jgi:zinc transport system substrate-binding protein